MHLPKQSIVPTVLASLLLSGLWPGTTARAQSPAPSPTASKPATNERRVVLVVWDGLRPDSISDETTPTLAKLAREGVFFARHHPVYPSMTEVNGTAMATGCYPGHSGLIGNREFRPAIDPLKTLAMENIATVRKGDDVTGGKYLRVPTLPELLQAAGQRTVVTGTKGVVVLMDRATRAGAGNAAGRPRGSQVLFEGKTLPPDLAGALDERLHGPFPAEIHFPNVEQDAWTTRALTEFLWDSHLDGLPGLTVLWMSDPDFTQHQFGPDSPQARRALASVDADLGVVLEELARQHVRDTTDVLVVSDHGFSTIGRRIDLAALLTDAGFNATREYKSAPKPGDILVDGLGGSVYLYVAGHDADTVRRVAVFLEGSDFAGVIFTRDALPGTFAMGAAHIDSPDAPDIAVSLRWNDDKSATGFPGLVVSDGGRKPGQGTHATLSRYDMHNTLVAAGRDFQKGWRDEMPTGNVDLAPTIAHLLGLPRPTQMDGRVLYESFLGLAAQLPPPPVTQRVEAKQENAGARWSQYLQVTHYWGVDYIDEGNGTSEPKSSPSAGHP